MNSGIMKKIKEVNEALPGMMLLSLIYLVIGEIVIFFLMPMVDKERAFWFYGVGFAFGVVYAVFASFHLSLGIRKVVYGNANQRSTYLLGYFLRLLVMVGMFAVLYIFQIGDLLAALIGIFAMKFSAYLQPLLWKVTGKGSE